MTKKRHTVRRVQRKRKTQRRHQARQWGGENLIVKAATELSSKTSDVLSILDNIIRFLKGDMPILYKKINKLIQLVSGQAIYSPRRDQLKLSVDIKYLNDSKTEYENALKYIEIQYDIIRTETESASTSLSNILHAHHGSEYDKLGSIIDATIRAAKKVLKHADKIRYVYSYIRPSHLLIPIRGISELSTVPTSTLKRQVETESTKYFEFRNSLTSAIDDVEASIEQANLAKTNAKSLAGEGNAASPAILKKEALRQKIRANLKKLDESIGAFNKSLAAQRALRDAGYGYPSLAPAPAPAGIVPAGGAGHAGPATISGEGGTDNRFSSNDEAIAAVRAAGAAARARGENTNNNNL